MDHEHKPIGDVLPGVNIAELDEGWVAYEAIVLVKCLDADGQVRTAARATEGMAPTEAIGTLIGALDLYRAQYLNNWTGGGG